MKKIYLLSAAVLAAASMYAAPQVSNMKMANLAEKMTNRTTTDAKALKAPAMADETTSMVFSLAQDEPYNAFPINPGKIGYGISMTEAQTALYAGNQISIVEIAAPLNMQKSDQETYTFVNTLTDCTVQLYKDLTADPVYTCAGKLGDKGFEWNKLTLEQPYTIEAGAPLYITVMFDDVTVYDAVVVTDGMRAVDPNASWVYSRLQGVSSSGNPQLQANYEWKDLGNIVGSVSLRAYITGAKLPQNRAAITNTSVPLAISPNTPFIFDFQFENQGANPINDVEVTMEFEGMEPQSYTCAPESGTLAYGKSDYATAQFQLDHEGIAVPYTAYISKVNGQPNSLMDQMKEGTILCIEEGYQRVVMAEEITSTYCGWCPIGIVGMESLRERFGHNGWWAGMAVHCNFNGQTDPMNVCSTGMAYADFAESCSGYLPTAYLFRDFSLDVQPNEATLMSIFNAYNLTPAPVSVKATLEGEGRDVTLKVETQFILDVEDADLGIAYTITEDEVGPYMQTNSCSGGTDVEYGDFRYLSKNTPWIYNDVVRAGSVYEPIANSIPTSLLKDETYEFTTKIDNRGVDKLENYAVTAIVVDRKTGKALNCHRVWSPEATKDNSVKGIEAEFGAPLAIGQEGSMLIFGSGDVYSVSGQLVAKNAKGQLDVPAGIYLVRNDKGSSKVIVR